MPRSTWMPWLSACALTVVAGCADNAMVLKGRVTQFEQQQAAMTRQNQQLQDRASSLDRDNQEMGTLLAQTRQQSKVLEDQLAATARATPQRHGAIGPGAGRQAELRQESPGPDRVDAAARRRVDHPEQQLPSDPAYDSPARRLRASRRRRDPHRAARRPAVRRRRAQLRPGAANLVADVASELRRTYPDQIIGIEGHTDSDPIAGGQWRNNHQLAIARAMAVQDVIVSSGRFRADQILVVGHGANHPVVSNATPQGKQRNRRVELVVYPERRGQ